MEVITLLKRNVKWRYHHRLTIVFTLLQPLLWLVLYSTVGQNVMQSVVSINYTTYILPGLMFLVCFGSSSSSGIMNYFMKQDGSFKRMLIAPIKRESIVLAQILESTLCAFLEVGVLTLMSCLFGVDISLNLFEFSIIMMILFLSSFFMSTLAYSISLWLPNEMVYETMMNALVLPLFFLSSSLFPIDQIDGILGIIIRINPFTHCIQLVRMLLLHQEIQIQNIIYVMILFIILCIVGFVISKLSLNKEMNK
ncbi:ABC transporter permease [Anaerorhabdus sp.]|uniref:ABC transporter permease n=1 Tax=Anaerorhabdus sp. TaxID=1872524 RepID=UPI002FC8A52C